MSSKQSFLGMVSVLCVAGALAGCGGGDGGANIASNVNAQPGSGTTPQASGAGGSGAADAFISRVLAILGSSSDTAEPVDIGTITVTTPDNAEPVPLS